MTGLLRHARRQHSDLSQNQPHAFAARFALVHYASGAVYSYIPKNACTTLRYSLALANGAIAGPEDFGWIHANNPTFAASLRELATAPYSFVILRCPYARLASVFLDKFVAKGPEAWAFRRHLHDTVDLDGLSFRDFVTHLESPKIRQSNPHWRSQADFLVYEAYSDVFAFEDLTAAFSRIQTQTGLVIEDARKLSGHGTDGLRQLGDASFADAPVHELAAMRRSGQAPAAPTLFDDAIRETVRNLYDGDFQLYSRHLNNHRLLFTA